MIVFDILIVVMLVVGGIFGLVGSFGLIRMPDAMTRLHAPTKATTLGVGGVLIASMLHFAAQGTASAHELMITLFLFLTAPIVAHFIAKAHLHLTVRRDELPKPEGGGDWAGFGAGATRGRTPDKKGRDAGAESRDAKIASRSDKPPGD